MSIVLIYKRGSCSSFPCRSAGHEILVGWHSHWLARKNTHHSSAYWSIAVSGYLLKRCTFLSEKKANPWTVTIPLNACRVGLVCLSTGLYRQGNTGVLHTIRHPPRARIKRMTAKLSSNRTIFSNKPPVRLRHAIGRKKKRKKLLL